MTNAEIKNKAKEMVEKHGKKAVEIAKRKAEAFKTESREKDFALMLLTEVEKLIDYLV